MKNTIEVLDALKAKTGAPSDYALHKILGVTRQAISLYRSGNGSFSDEMALKVASILEVEPCLILAIAYADRTANSEVKAVWKTVLERVSGVAAMCLLATGITAFKPAPVLASEVGGMAQEYTLCECYYINVFTYYFYFKISRFSSHLSTLYGMQNYVPS